MKIAQLETFVVVAEELHFRRAADRLFTQPSTVSTQISQLEAEYGTPLFIRNSRNVTLSPAGQTLLEKAKAALASIADLERTAKSLAAGDAATLTVGAMDEGLAELNQVVASNYSARLPQCRINLVPLDYADLTLALQSGEVDAVVAIMPAFEAGVAKTIPLFSERRSVVLPVNHALADRDEVHSRDLMDLPFLHIAGFPIDLERFFMLTDQRDFERSPPVDVAAAHMHGLLNHVAAHDGIFTVTRGTERFYPRPDIAYVPVPDLESGTFSVAIGADEHRPHVLSYVEACVDAVNTSLDLIPTATNATRTP